MASLHYKLNVYVEQRQRVNQTIDRPSQFMMPQLIRITHNVCYYTYSMYITTYGIHLHTYMYIGDRYVLCTYMYCNGVEEARVQP